MQKVKQENRVKISFTCTAPKYMTEFNLDVNSDIVKACKWDEKFRPRLGCVGCEYLETTTYRKKGKKWQLRTFEELIKETDALTFLNAYKVTQSEIKQECANLEEMSNYTIASVDRIRKLMRKSDNLYRIVAKLSQNSEASLTDVTVEEHDVDPDDQIKEIMEGDK